MKTRSNGPSSRGGVAGAGPSTSSTAAVRPAGGGLSESAAAREPGAREALAGDRRVARLVVECDEVAARAERPGEPQRAVARERADLEDPPGARPAREQLEQAPLDG